MGGGKKREGKIEISRWRFVLIQVESCDLSGPVLDRH